MFMLAKSSNLKSVLKSTLKFMPSGMKRWVSDNKGYAQKLIDEGQLQPVFVKAVDFINSQKDIEFGDYYEFGVYNGTSLTLLYHVLKEAGMDKPRLFGFDSFEGLPQEAEFDDEGFWTPGQFKCDYDFAKARLEKNGVDMSRVELIKGFYSDSLKPEIIPKYKMKKASIIMIDCDMYLSARDALAFCVPLIQDKTIILFDDWNDDLKDKNLGEKRAFEEFLAANKQFKSTPFAKYRFKNLNNGKVFLVENIGK